MINITSIPEKIETNQPCLIKGTASGDRRGKSVELIIDNQYKVSSGKVADDGTWQIDFVFLSVRQLFSGRLLLVKNLLN